ncbi:hypothetical protein ACGFMO_37350 [Streptomyces niveus]|uniref:hypothetical protein n=1 Tax=Streptomyces niveus TaxID=193462 RepID=UPI0037102A6A
MPDPLAIALSISAAALAAALPAVRRAIHQHRAARGAWHRRQQLIHAADWTITLAVREALARPVLDLREPDHVRRISVRVADVRRRATADFNVELDHQEAEAILRERLKFRSYSQNAITDPEPGSQ